MQGTSLHSEVKLERRRVIDWAVLFASAAVALLYLYTARFGQLPTYQQRGILLAFCFILIYVKSPMLKAKGRRPRWTIPIDVALSVGTVLAVYQLVKVELMAKPGFQYMTTIHDTVLGAILIVATIEATRRMLGLAIPILAGVFLAYALFGHNMPGILNHAPLDFSTTVYYVSLTAEGIFGVPIYVVSSFVIVFLLLAALLDKLGLMDFFIGLAAGLMGRYRGGPAKIAVVASAFLATMSGSAVANVAATGSFTIPLMKRIGYSPDFAGAVEASASTGGVVTPPVMGAAAFIIAEYLGISYWSVAVAAFLPALLYFISVYMGVDLEAMKTGLRGMPKSELPSVRKVLLSRGYMSVPILVLVYFLGIVRSSPMLAGFWAIVSILVVAAASKDGRRRLSGVGFLEGLAAGVKDALVVVATCAGAGIIIGVLIVTGLTLRLGTSLLELSGGNLLLLLLLSAVLCIILGMGMTTTAVYILVAIVVAPTIIRLGVPPLAAHLFVFFFGNLSHITPPVCISVFVACGISGGRFLPTAWQAIRLGGVLFIVPFFFSFNPGLILQGSPSSVAISAVTAITGVIVLAFAINNHWWWGRISLLSRVLFGVGGLALVYPNALVSLAGAALALIAVLYQVLLRKRERLASRPGSAS